MKTQTRLLTFAILVTVCALSALTLAPTVAQDAPTAPCSVADIIASDGAFSFSDGSSIYTLRQDHAFSLSPLGISGQTITGVWSLTDDGQFLISGQWGWDNGISAIDDYREMHLHITCTGDKKKAPDTYRDVEIYPVEFSIKGLKKLDKAPAPLP